MQMQSGSANVFQTQLLQCNLNYFLSQSSLATKMETEYNRFRIKRVIARFLPTKRSMTAQQVNQATSVPLNPPMVDVYVVPIYQYSEFAPQVTLNAILQQTGVYKVNGTRPFSVSFRPRVEYNEEYAGGLTVPRGRIAPVFPLMSVANTTTHWGRCVYIRMPYDASVPSSTGVTFMQYQIEWTAIVEFFDVKN